MWRFTTGLPDHWRCQYYGEPVPYESPLTSLIVIQLADATLRIEVMSRLEEFSKVLARIESMVPTTESSHQDNDVVLGAIHSPKAI